MQKTAKHYKTITDRHNPETSQNIKIPITSLQINKIIKI